MSNIETGSCNLDAFDAPCSGMSHLVRKWPGSVERALGPGVAEDLRLPVPVLPSSAQSYLFLGDPEDSPFSWASLHAEVAKVRKGLGGKGEREGKGKTKSK